MLAILSLLAAFIANLFKSRRRLEARSSFSVINSISFDNIKQFAETHDFPFPYLH